MNNSLAEFFAMGGYAGYVNFGTSAFFGVGVYASVFLVKAFGAPLPLQILIAAAIGARAEYRLSGGRGDGRRHAVRHLPSGASGRGL